MTGEKIGNYSILEKRGEGGMGIFYKAHDDVLDEVVGLKTLHPELVADAEFRRQLQEEAKLQARLRGHPGIVRLNHYLILDDRHYLVMEYVEGHTLSEIINDRGPYSFAEAGPIIVKVLDALNYAHQQGIIHRDIKPSNIMITENGDVKVTDFGIAKLLSGGQQTRTSQVKGSLFYMAPEQIRQQQLDSRTDIYALGVTLYEMLTGTLPFTGASEYDIMQQHLESPPRLPSKVNSALTDEDDRLIMRAMAKKPGDRFTDTAAMAAAIQKRLEAKTSRDSSEISVPIGRWLIYGIAAITLVVAGYFILKPAGSDHTTPEDDLEEPLVHVDSIDTTTPTAEAPDTVHTNSTELDQEPVIQQPTEFLTVRATPFNREPDVTGVWLDGRRIGSTLPLQYGDITSGVHWLKIATTTATWSDTVRWEATDRDKVFHIVNDSGVVIVSAAVPDQGFAWIFVDGEDIEKDTPHRIHLPLGPHRIDVRLEGYSSVEGPRFIRVKPGPHEVRLEFTLQPER